MMKNILKTIYTLLILGLMISCGSDEIDTSSFDSVLDAGGPFEPVVENTEETPGQTTEETRGNVVWRCTSKTDKAEAAGGGEGGFPSFNPNSSVIYPGSLLQGASLNNATPDIIAVDRAGGSISTDVIDGSIAPSFTVDEMSLSQVTIALNNIIANSTGVIPANFDFDYYNVQSEEEFALKAKLDVKTIATRFKGKLDFSTDKEYNRFVVELNQSFYTMRYDIPTSWDDVFAPSVTPEQLARYTGPGNPASYISDVTYGRIYTMLVESTSSVTEMEAAVKGAFRGIGAKVEGEVDTEYFNSLNELRIKVFAFGGKDRESLLTINAAQDGNLSELVELLAEASDIRTGKPISYVVRSMFNNQIVSVKLATEYNVKNCVPTQDPNAPPYTRHWAGLSQEFGGVGAAYCPDGTRMILINQEGTHYMESDIGTLDGPFPISRLAGGEPCPVDGIGAICNIDGNEDASGWAFCIDQTGSQYFYLRSSGWGSNPPELIANMADGRHPFKVEGVGAAAFLWKDSDGPSSRSFWNYDGDRYTNYVNNPKNFRGPYDNELFKGIGPNFPFDYVGAAIGLNLGNEHVVIVFDKLGTSYIVTAPSLPQDHFIGPFTI